MWLGNDVRRDNATYVVGTPWQLVECRLSNARLDSAKSAWGIKNMVCGFHLWGLWAYKYASRQLWFNWIFGLKAAEKTNQLLPMTSHSSFRSDFSSSDRESTYEPMENGMALSFGRPLLAPASRIGQQNGQKQRWLSPLLVDAEGFLAPKNNVSIVFCRLAGCSVVADAVVSSLAAEPGLASALCRLRDSDAFKSSFGVSGLSWDI